MKNLLLFIVFASLWLSASAQELVTDSLGFETFEMTEGDTTYVMKKYFMAFLKRGAVTDHSPQEASKIQEGHMAHMNQMADEGKIDIAGPFGDDGEMRGIIIFNVATQEEVEALVAKDPAVIAGRLILEVHPWWAAKGSKLN